MVELADLSTASMSAAAGSQKSEPRGPVANGVPLPPRSLHRSECSVQLWFAIIQIYVSLVD